MPHQRFMASPLTSTNFDAIFTLSLATTGVDRQDLSNAGRTENTMFSIF